MTLPSARPLTSRLRRLTYPQKFLLVSLCFIVAVTVAVWFLIEEQNLRIAFAQKEIDGTHYLRPLSTLFISGQEYNLAQEQLVKRDAPDAEALAVQRTQVERDLAALEQADRIYGFRLGTGEQVAMLRRYWAELKPLDPLPQLFFRDLRNLMDQVGNRSNLILDPDLDSYYMMDAVLLRLPENYALIYQIRTLGERVLAAGRYREGEQFELVTLVSLIHANYNALQKNMGVAFTNNPAGDLRPQLSDPLKDLLESGRAYAVMAQWQVAYSPDLNLDPDEFHTTADEALNASLAFYEEASLALERLLEARIAALRERQLLVVSLTLVISGAATLLGLVIMQRISHPLSELAASANRLAAGDLSARVSLENESEMGRVGAAFNRMADEIQAGRALLEQRVAERTSELLIATAEAEQARVAAEEASKAKSIFLANMSHELRTPLNAIIGYSEMLTEEAADSGLDTFLPDLEKIQTAGRHLLGLINDILDLSKIEAGRMELYPEIFSADELVAEVITNVVPQVEKSGNMLKLELELSTLPGIDGVPGLMQADRIKLRQVLINLLSNAAKFTEQGSITLAVTGQIIEGRPWLRWEVRDTGIGMTAEQLGRLFRNFTQGDASTTRRYGGTGLGLALSRHFCQMMGGDITVTSTPGVGSTFVVHLPVEHAEERTHAPGVYAHHGESSTPTGQAVPLHLAPTILVIDDDRNTRDLLSRALTREGLRIVTASEGSEGVQMARELRPDAITLDVMLPDTDGWSVLSILKADPDLADIPVIMLTIIEDQHTGYALGAAEFLTKPVDRQRLVAAVNRHCRSFAEANGHNNAPVLVVEDDEPTRMLLRRTLEHAGWHVEEAANGQLALDQIAAGPTPALILLDLMMPEVDGFGFVEQLHRNEEWRRIPIIVLTATDLTPDQRHSLNGAVSQILQKGATDRDRLLIEVRERVVDAVRGM